jgi:hypothetical protein
MEFAPCVVYDTWIMTALAGLGSDMAFGAHIARYDFSKDFN